MCRCGLLRQNFSTEMFVKTMKETLTYNSQITEHFLLQSYTIKMAGLYIKTMDKRLCIRIEYSIYNS